MHFAPIKSVNHSRETVACWTLCPSHPYDLISSSEQAPEVKINDPILLIRKPRLSFRTPKRGDMLCPRPHSSCFAHSRTENWLRAQRLSQNWPEILQSWVRWLRGDRRPDLSADGPRGLSDSMLRWVAGILGMTAGSCFGGALPEVDDCPS